MELSKLQQEILDTNQSRTVITAAAASGKSRLLTEKVRQLLRDGVSPNKIAVVTFTRLAAMNLVERLGKDYKNGLFVGTIHSLASHFLCKKGKINLVKKCVDSADFDKLFPLCKDYLDVYKAFDWVVLDEGQDSTKYELEFIFDMIQPDNFFIALDPKQCIYRFRNAAPDLVQSYLMNRNPKIYTMNENYRNCVRILDFAKEGLLGSNFTDDSISMRKASGKVITTRYDSISTLNYLRNMDEYKDWAILVRLNSQMRKFSELMNNHNIPYVNFKQGGMTPNQLEKIMNQNAVKLLTIHSSKGLEFKNVIVNGTRKQKLNIEEYCINYTAATRARDFLLWT